MDIAHLDSCIGIIEDFFYTRSFAKDCSKIPISVRKIKNNAILNENVA